MWRKRAEGEGRAARVGLRASLRPGGGGSSPLIGRDAGRRLCAHGQQPEAISAIVLDASLYLKRGSRWPPLHAAPSAFSICFNQGKERECHQNDSLAASVLSATLLGYAAAAGCENGAAAYSEQARVSTAIGPGGVGVRISMGK